MLLTISTTHRPATDLGYLLHKNPGRAGTQTTDLAVGQARVFYPEAGDDRCTAVLVVEIDPIGLVRRGRGGDAFSAAHYVNDRPYVASSFLSVAIAKVFGSALAGRSRERPELVDQALPLVARVAAVPTGGDPDFVRRLFEPLGYRVALERSPGDGSTASEGGGSYAVVELRAEIRLRDLLTHLYVLIPVLDAEKHYWVGEDEIAKLLRHGEGWLTVHPERETIAARYLKGRRTLVADALARLAIEDAADPDLPPATVAGDVDDRSSRAGQLPSALPRLHDQRLDATIEALRASGARRVLDLGCGEGQLLARLLDDPHFTEIVGMDVSVRALETAADRLGLDRLPAAQRERISLLHGSLTYRDRRLHGFEAAAVVEVVEHLDPWRLAAFERVLFGDARPETTVLTTPNRDYNVRLGAVGAGALRHPDHRFEWSRDEFLAWATAVGERHGYRVEVRGVGADDSEVGTASQLAIFTRRSADHKRTDRSGAVPAEPGDTDA